MEYIADIKQIYADDVEGIARVEIEYSNGTDTKLVNYRLSDPDTLKQIARNEIAEMKRLEKVKDFIDNFPTGELDISLPAPIIKENNPIILP